MKVGIIGAGFIAELHAQAYEHCGGVEIVGVADTDLERAGALAAAHGCAPYPNAEKMLDEARPDAVSVCIPTWLHTDAVCQAAAGGAHVLCEKPLALTDQDCLRMLQAEKQYGVRIMAAQVLRWWPEYRAAWELKQSGRLGAVRCMTSSRLLHGSRGGWFLDRSRSGGPLFDLMAHDADFMLWLLGSEIQSLYAVSRCGDEAGRQHIMALIRYEDGAQVCLEAANSMPEGFPFTTLLRLEGEKAALVATSGTAKNISLGAKTETSMVLTENGAPQSLPVAHDNVQEKAFDAEIAAFVRGVETGEMPIPLQESVKAIRLLNLIGKSMDGAGEIRNISRELAR